ncbi:winged helix-turn-helix transcriptional regulator [uncultured Fibrobacter sp.]|uniref:winged helix-turn-helix transcriptional regulator n=1 Tax=uncultured Fibrobacter sp. TaxID=261512 RepID=UPI00261F793B|nr:winged helix-turn-helix transcriptional regulator [uncultured Fibrobacter sp.]
MNENYSFDAENEVGGQMGGQIGGQIALNERQLDILQIIKNNPSVTRKMLAEMLGINESAVQKHLETLKQNGVIRHIGKTRGHWEVRE